MANDNVTPIRAGINMPPPGGPKGRRSKRATKTVRVHRQIAELAQIEMSRLWQAHGIIGLVVESIGDEPDTGKPAIKSALRAAADIILASINALEPISMPGILEVAHG